MKFKDLAHQRHADFLDDMELLAGMALEFVGKRLTSEVLGLLKKKNLLAKSDDLKRGWTGEVPQIKVEFDEIFDRVMNKYMDSLRYMLLGKTAGVAAKNAAVAIGIDKLVVPGIIQSAYLDSIDTHRKHYLDLTGKLARPLRRDLIKVSMEQINQRSTRFVDESLLRLQNKVVTAVESAAWQTNAENTESVYRAEDGARDDMAKDLVKGSLDAALESYKTDWQRMVAADLQLASAVGTHQAVAEVYGAEDREVKVAWVALRDEKTCQFCKEASRDAAGDFKLYSIGDFKPAGFNYGRKRADWQLCIPGAHPNCRCSLIYCPNGFEITKAGDVQPRKKSKPS